MNRRWVIPELCLRTPAKAKRRKASKHTRRPGEAEYGEPKQCLAAVKLGLYQWLIGVHSQPSIAVQFEIDECIRLLQDRLHNEHRHQLRELLVQFHQADTSLHFRLPGQFRKALAKAIATAPYCDWYRCGDAIGSFVTLQWAAKEGLQFSGIRAVKEHQIHDCISRLPSDFVVRDGLLSRLLAASRRKPYTVNEILSLLSDMATGPGSCARTALFALLIDDVAKTLEIPVQGIQRQIKVESNSPSPQQVKQGDSESTSVARNSRQGSAGELKIPTDQDWAAYRIYKELGTTQTAVAELLSRELGKDVSQGTVSRACQKVTKWLAAGGAQVEPIKRGGKPGSLDPAVIEWGARADGHTPRQRDRRVDD